MGYLSILIRLLFQCQCLFHRYIKLTGFLLSPIDTLLYVGLLVVNDTLLHVGLLVKNDTLLYVGLLVKNDTLSTIGLLQ